MSVKLTVEIEAPIGPEDSAVLGPLAMALLALAAQQGGGEEETEEEDPDEPSDMQQVANEMYANGKLSNIPQPCGKVDEETGKVCAGLVGHRGRHLFRTMPGMPGVTH